MSIEKIQGIVSEGDVNVEGNMSIGDTFNNTYNEAAFFTTDISFQETQLVEKLDNDITPRVEQKIIKMLLAKRIIIIRNDSTLDLFLYQQELARSIQKTDPQKVFELFTNQNDNSILPKLMTRENKGIYLLNDIDTLHIDFDLAALHAIAHEKQIYFIINTDSSKSRWESAGQQLNDLWVEIDPNQLYDEQQLRFKLKEKVTDFHFIDKTVYNTSAILLSSSYTFEHVAEKIVRPLQLNLFLERYASFKKLPKDQELDELLTEIGGHSEDIIRRWFGKLNHKQKLITIAFTLFDGVYTSQFFEAIDQFFPRERESVWKISAPELAALDYKDISFLEPFIHEELVQGNERIVSSRSDFRRVVFKLIWKTYRRHLISVFPELIGILSESYKRKASNWELYGTTERRSILRYAFVESVSDLGIVQIDAAENILLDLAANGHYHLRGLVASSLARWRVHVGDEHLFALLKRWQENASILDLIHEKLERRISNVDRSNNPKESPIELIKSTVAITLSKAAEYDRKNHLDERLIELYVNLAKDDSEWVQLTVSKSLPTFIHKHVFQLKEVLFTELMQLRIYKDAISKGLLMATIDSPEEMKRVISEWLDASLESNSEENRRNKGTYRDNILLTILELVKDIITLPELSELFSTESLLAIGLKLLRAEGRSVVRDSVFEFLAILCVQDPTLGLKCISTIYQHFQGDDQKNFISYITDQYILQRAQQAGGDFQYALTNEIILDSWFNRSERPLTNIEKALINWINTNNVEAKRIATLVFLEIALLVEEGEWKNTIAVKKAQVEYEQNKIAREKARKSIARPVKSEIGISFWLRVRILFISLFEPKANRLALKDILRLLFNTKRYSIIHIQLMNEKWRKHDSKGLAGKLGSWLDRLIK